MLKSTFILFLLVSVFGSLTAERLIDNQIWTDYYLYKSLGESSSFVHRIGLRYNLPESDSKFLVHYRPSVRFKIGAFEPQVGSAIFYKEKQDDITRFELRPWVGLKHKLKVSSPVTLINLARLEYRLQNERVLQKMVDNDVRLRYRLGIRGVLLSGADSRSMYGLASAESFWNLTDMDQFDYNLLRLNTGFGASFNAKLRIELMYTSQLLQAGNLDLSKEYSNLFQLKFRHRL